VRIIGGALRGLRLAEVGAGDRAAHLRPTSDRVREAIFNLLINGGYGDPVGGARVLDLFAGTGALGLEALSRGAASAVFLDNGAAANALIRKNVATCHAEDRATLLKRDATRPGPVEGDAATLVFLDPPYGLDLGAPALLAAQAGGWIAPGAIVVWEEVAAQFAPEGFERLDARRYGDTWVTLLRLTRAGNL
jgi:16S rRNA (guanine966-N2)-methyltransferase